ncbi:MAG: hypothetical protein Q7R87_00205 [Nanoarchaeota archaeon]|nr:hypothetical protein [Nanoarchaeota archaeon]
MVTISRTVEKLVQDHPYIQEALVRGVLNYVAVAEMMHKDVQLIMNADVKISAIMMALRRLKEKSSKHILNSIKFGKESDVFVKSDLCEVTLKLNDDTREVTRKVYDFAVGPQDFLTVTQGLTQVTIIMNKRYKQKIINLTNKHDIINIIDNLACISTVLPIKSVDEPGFFFIITREFSWEQIPIVEIVSTLTELNFIVKEKYIPRAFTLFKDVIERNQ